MDASREETERKAYEIWEAEGRQDGLQEIYWSRAQALLAGEVDSSGGPAPQADRQVTAPNQDTSAGPDETAPSAATPAPTERRE